MQRLPGLLGMTFVPGPKDDLSPIYRAMEKSRIWAADTETTGLNMYEQDAAVRLVQVGNSKQAWLLRPDWDEHVEAIRDYVLHPGTHWHNFTFDALFLEAASVIPVTAEEVMANAVDTEIYSRLLDPRDQSKGGIGHHLKDLGASILRVDVKDARKAVVAAGRQYRKPDGSRIAAGEIWRHIPVDDRTYQMYAGQDIHLTAGVAAHLAKEIKARGLERFVEFEHILARRTMWMQHDGTAVDLKYAKNSKTALLAEVDKMEEELERLGVEKTTAAFRHTSKSSIMSVLSERGVKFTKRTPPSSRYPDGQIALDSGVLEDIAATGEPVARTVLQAKKAKHYADYMDGILTLAGLDGRIHPDIRPMRAATARMSISNPPLQQYPQLGVELSDGSLVEIRKAVVADKGHVLVSADFAQVEFRVAAAVSGDPVMRERILAGDDLHAPTAEIVFGPDFTKHERDIAKRVGFGRLYRGRPKSLAEQTGLPLRDVKKAAAAFDKAYKHTARWGDKIQESVRAGNTTVVTITGRPLIVEAPWAAVNYLIQSPARDVFAQGVLNLWKAGLGPYLRLVVHDEVILSVPKGEAKAIAKEVENSMNTTLRGIPIITEAKIIGRHWTKG